MISYRGKLLVVEEIEELNRIKYSIFHAASVQTSMNSGTNASLILSFDDCHSDSGDINVVILRCLATHDFKKNC